MESITNLRLVELAFYRKWMREISELKSEHPAHVQGHVGIPEWAQRKKKFLQ